MDRLGPLFDFASGLEARDVGIALAWDHEARGPEVIDAMRLTCERFPSVYHDCLYVVMDELGLEIRPMALGSVWKQAIKNRWIAKTNEEPRKSRRPKAHARPGPVYRSLIYKETDDGPLRPGVRNG